MLKKLLKYDFAAVIRLWGLGALAVLLISFGGGLCLRILISDRPIHGMIRLVSFIGVFLSYIAVLAFSILTFVLLAVRFYKNFFTDQGYLTFTLPVKLHSLINSKLLLVLIMEMLTGLVIIAGICILLTVGIGAEFNIIGLIFDGLGELIGLIKDKGYLGWFILYAVEVLMLSIVSSAFGVLFMGCCITFGSVIAKRAKVLAAILVYYGANSVFSMVVWIFTVFGTTAYGSWLSSANLTATQGLGIAAMTLLGIFALMAMLCSLLYTLQYRLLDRKLNLP